MYPESLVISSSICLSGSNYCKYYSSHLYIFVFSESLAIFKFLHSYISKIFGSVQFQILCRKNRICNISKSILLYLGWFISNKVDNIANLRQIRYNFRVYPEILVISSSISLSGSNYRKYHFYLLSYTHLLRGSKKEKE